MKTLRKTKIAVVSKRKKNNPIESDFFKRSWEESWTYIKTVVDVIREPMLILDKDLRVMVANEPFYSVFHVLPKDTENKIIYELGNGQWNIPSLRKLLEDILPRDTFFRGFEVAHEFPSIGKKVMILNARQIHNSSEDDSNLRPPIILLAMEDITEMIAVADTIASNSKLLEVKLSERIDNLESVMKKVAEEIIELKSRGQ
jgi:hypothetical protein